MSRKTRKLIWSAPLVAVLAVAGALAIFAALSPNGALAHEAAMHGPPGPVTGILADPVADDPDTPAHEGRTSVTISWQVPADDPATTDVDEAGAPATSYRIDRSVHARVWTNIVSSIAADEVGCDPDGDSQSCSYTDPMLTPGATYNYRVFAMNGNDISPVSVDDTYDEAMTEPVGAPEAPSTLMASRNLEKEIRLSWTTPADDGGADLEWYCIVVGNSGVTLNDLATGVDAANNLCKNMTAETMDTALGRLTNELGAGAGASPTQGVIVISATETDDDDNTVPVTKYTHTGLVGPNEITLRYRIYAVNESDEISSYITNTAVGKTVEGAVDPETVTVIREPGAVENLRAVAAVIGVDETATVNLYWTVPDNHPTAAQLTDANANATRAIVLEYYTGDAEIGDDGWVVVPSSECQADTEDLDGQVHQCAITSSDLATGSGSRTYRVKYDITDSSDDSVIINGLENAGSRASVRLPITTTSAAPNDANAPTDVLPLITASNGNDGDSLRFQPHAATPQTAIDLLWQRDNNQAVPVAQPTGYVIEYSTDKGVTWKSLPNIDSPRDLGTNTRYTHHGVEPGDRYDYRVFPWHNSVYGLPETIPASSLAADRPDPVLNLRVTADGTDTLELDWDMPAKNGGSDILGYLVQVSADDNNDMTNGNAKSTTVSNWPSQVASIDDANTEDIDESIVTTTATEYTYKPDTNDAPSGPLTDGNVRWFRVFAINVANDGYVMTGGREVGDDGNPVSGDRDLDNTDTPHADDISAAREVKGVTEDLTAPGPDDPRQPAPPGDPVGFTSEPAHSNNRIAMTDRGVLLLWNEPTPQMPAIDVESYVVERMVVGVDASYQPEGMVTWATSLTDERTAYVDDDPPDPGEVRMYRVSAKNDDGSSGWVEVMYPSHAAMHMPTPPQSVTAVVDSASAVTVSWMTPADDGGSDITGLTVRWKQSDATSYAAADMAMADAMASSHMVSGLMGSTSYDFQVIATNAIGDSYPSMAATAMTMATVTELTAPSAVMATDTTTNPGNFMIEVTWTAGENADGGHLVLLFPSDFSDLADTAVPTEEGRYSFTGVSAGDYVVVVVSIKSSSEYLYAYDTVAVGQ
jgi:hypothetical protein